MIKTVDLNRGQLVNAGWSGEEIVMVGGAQRTNRLVIANGASL
jgi:hypothetical protein